MMHRHHNMLERFSLIFRATLLCLVLCFAGAATSMAEHLNRSQNIPIADAEAVPVTGTTLAAMENYHQPGTHVFQIVENPLVFLIAFDNLQEQGRALNRIGLFVENAETTGRILSQQEASTLLSSEGKRSQKQYLGHDYRATDLAAFFSVLTDKGIPMTAEEAFVLRILTQNQVIQWKNGAFHPVAPHKVLLALTRPEVGSDQHLSPTRWRLVLRHEASHGEYFTNPRYRDYCRAFWTGFSEKNRQIFRDELHFLSYDPNNEDLMINEMQAFLWEPSISGFIECRLQKHQTSLAALRERFLSGILTAQTHITAFFNSDFTRELLPGDSVSVFAKKEEKACAL